MKEKTTGAPARQLTVEDTSRDPSRRRARMGKKEGGASMHKGKPREGNCEHQGGERGGGVSARSNPSPDQRNLAATTLARSIELAQLARVPSVRMRVGPKLERKRDCAATARVGLEVPRGEGKGGRERDTLM